MFRVADVEFATLEANGDLSILLKRDKQPLTIGDVQKYVPEEKEPQTVIMDGEILDEPLATARLNRGWLKKQLDQMGVAVENVFLAQVDSYGQLTVDLYDDRIQVPEPRQKQLLLASMKKQKPTLNYSPCKQTIRKQNKCMNNKRNKCNNLFKTTTVFNISHGMHVAFRVGEYIQTISQIS